MAGDGMTIGPWFERHGARCRSVASSISELGYRVDTIQTRYPRMVHSEVMTHRVFSRNGRSSRAVPVVTMMEEAKHPYIPFFMKNRPGMTASEHLSEAEAFEAEAIWRAMAESCREGVLKLQEIGVHKQWANRPLEWFGYIDVLITSVCWANWDALRLDGGAQPEVRDIAKVILAARNDAVPSLLKPGEWHLPYILEEERSLDVELLKRLSTARSARLTIKPFDGDASHEAELSRYERLMISQPVHASPAEHQCTPDVVIGRDQKGRLVWDDGRGNLLGWRQHRHEVPHESVPDPIWSLVA